MAKRTYRAWTEVEDRIILGLARRKDEGLPCSSWDVMARYLNRKPGSIKQRLTLLRRRAKEAAERPGPAVRSCSACGRRFRVTPRRRMLCATCFANGDGGIDV